MKDDAAQPIRFQRLSERGEKHPPMIGKFRHGQLVFAAFADGSFQWIRSIDETCDQFEDRVLDQIRELFINRKENDHRRF